MKEMTKEFIMQKETIGGLDSSNSGSKAKDKCLKLLTRKIRPRKSNSTIPSTATSRLCPTRICLESTRLFTKSKRKRSRKKSKTIASRATRCLVTIGAASANMREFVKILIESLDQKIADCFDSLKTFLKPSCS